MTAIEEVQLTEIFLLQVATNDLSKWIGGDKYHIAVLTTL